MPSDLELMDGTLVPAGGVAGGGTAAAPGADRMQRLTTGVRSMRLGGGRIAMGEHTLMLIGGIIAPLGLVLVLIGWYGAAHTPNLFEQVPYMISGGLLGVALVVLGGFLYFAHWLTQLIKETRAHANVMSTALERLEELLAHQVARPDVTVATGAEAAPAATGRRTLVAAPALVATAKGTMMHRPNCVIVAGKEGLRAVDESDGLAPCKLCESGTPT